MSKSISEHVVAIVKAGVSAVPYVGGPVASLIGDYIPTATQQSVENMFDEFRRQLDATSERIDVSKVDKDEFSELFKSAYTVMLRTHDKRKLHAAARLLTNILLKDGDPEKLSYTELDHYARCLEFLSHGAIEVLAHAVVIATRTDADSIETQSCSFSFSELKHRMPDTESSVLMGLVGELDSMNVIHRRWAPYVQTSDYGTYILELTPLGAKLARRLLVSQSTESSSNDQ